MKLTPNITLSNDRVIGSRYAENGSQDLFDVADPERVANLTEAEHAEVMNAIHEFRNPPILTTQLRSGRTVLAKVYECFTMAVTYANRTQAQKKVARLGDEWEVYKGTGRPFYVAKKETL